MNLVGQGAPFTIVPVNPIRHGAARVLDLMRQTTAPVSVVTEVDCTNLKRLYGQLKPQYERAGVPLTYTPLFARATVKALQANPIMNSTFTPMGYMVHRNVHLGIATQTPGVVLLPTIQFAETKSVPQLAQEVNTIAEKARTGRLLPLPENSTFVITNTGKYGQTLFGTPTIKPPNVGILAFETIQKRPVVTADDRIEVRPMMYIVLTADHKAVDGSQMAAFVGDVKKCIENVAF